MMIFFDVWGKNNTPIHYANDNWLIPLINLAYIDVGRNYLLLNNHLKFYDLLY